MGCQDIKRKNIYLRSEEMQEIMGKVPPAIFRLTILLIASLTFTIIILCSRIQYPESLWLNVEMVQLRKNLKGKNEVIYCGNVGLKQKKYVKRNLHVTVTFGDVRVEGIVTSVGTKYDQKTGLFPFYVSIWIPEGSLLPLFIQFKNETSICINVSQYTVLEKLIGIIN